MYMSKLVSGVVTTMAETPENSDEEWEDEARRLMEKKEGVKCMCQRVAQSF